jgi:glycosyltransferase involved in cell wall biosynthesis
MPNYNDARFLAEALEAVLAQDHGSFELLVVDDGSTDESLSIMQGYAGRDPRIRVFAFDQNCGYFAAAGRALAVARGEFLYLASANDRVLPGFFGKTIRLLSQHPAAGFCWTDPSHFFESGGSVYRRKTGLTEEPAYLSPKDLVRLYETGRLSAPFHAAPAMIRRAAFDSVGGYHPELRWYSDFFMVLVLAFRGGMCYLPEALTSTRVQSASYSSGAGDETARNDVLTRMLDLLLSDAYRDIAPRVKQSGALSYFGRPVFKLAGSDPKYREVLDDRFRRRAWYFSLKHQVRRLASPRFQRMYFAARQFFRPGAAGPGPVSSGPSVPSP